jgi:hypothetical protein
MTQLLIEELTPSQAGLIVESTQDQQTYWLSGTFMQADIKNRNGRNYPMNEISRAVENGMKRIQETQGLLGELDHPNSLTINLDRVSHVITELRMEGNNAFGKAKLLNTPMGLIAKELVKSGISIGVSSRGAGQVNESGMVNMFEFITVDIVAHPSAPNAYPSTIVESLDMYKNGNNVVSLAEALKHDKTAQKYFEKEIKRWLSESLFLKK